MKIIYGKLWDIILNRNMKINYRIIYLLFILISCSKNEVITNPSGNFITTQGLNFVPKNVNISLGDTVFFDLGPSHNAVEVSKSVYDNNGNTPLIGGFNFNYGESGSFIPDEAKTYYFVCQPHLPTMKGIIIVE